MSKRLQLRFVVMDTDGARRDLALVGQFARTLKALIEAGPKGVTSLDVARTWALRLGHYVWMLRHRDRLSITTLYEAHDGAAGPGKHARYILQTPAEVVTDGNAEAA